MLEQIPLEKQQEKNAKINFNTIILLFFEFLAFKVDL
jgi:hypothetical protein